ncbi:MAG: uroporphyrinogen decarboxylase family protein [Sedimentisphaerales bacterium]
MLEIPAAYVGQAMGNDIRQAWVSNNYAMEGIVHENTGECHMDFWGIEWIKECEFNQIARFPLAGKAHEEILNYHWPLEHIDELAEQMTAAIAEKENFFIGCDVSPCVFELYCRLRGLEDGIFDIAAAPVLASEMFEQCADFSVKLAQYVCNRFEIDWLWSGDDVGSQMAMMINPATWRIMVEPHLKRIHNVAKERGLWVAFHSCGSIRPIIADLIETGVDVLNPIQCNCPGMEPLELKKEFGKKLAFMGGVDTQGVLPNGTAEQVTKATARLINGMTGDGGGYILAASHTIPPETPDDNIFAMYEVAGLCREEIFDNAAYIRKTLSYSKSGNLAESN